jgi:Domain of unknown function (DUF4160)
MPPVWLSIVRGDSAPTNTRPHVDHAGSTERAWENLQREPVEPMHVHVRGGTGQAKFWMKPVVHLDSSSGLDARTLRELSETVQQNADLIEKQWSDHFG